MSVHIRYLIKAKMAKYPPREGPPPIDPTLVADAVALLKNHGVAPLASGEYVMDFPGDDYYLVK